MAMLFALLGSFALLIGIYMEVINRYVDSSVQIWSSPAAESGGSLVFRATTFRPNSRERIDGTVTLESRPAGNEPGQTSTRQVETGSLSPFVLRVPRATSEQLNVSLAATTGEGHQHAGHIGVPVRERLPPVSAISAARRPSTRDPVDRPRVQLVRTEPRDAPWRLRMTPEGGIPVRFLENTFIIQLTRADGMPLGMQDVTIEVPPESFPSAQTVRTDRFGLGAFRATPEDLALWRLHAVSPAGPMTATFEIVPSFDGLVLRPASSLINEGEPIVGTVQSGLTVEELHFDVVADGVLQATETATATESIAIRPPTGTWPVGDDAPRLLLFQVGSNPFSRNPQNAVRCVWAEPQSWGRSQSVERILETVAQADVQRDYIGMVVAQGLVDENASSSQTGRLLSFLCGQIRPRFTPLEVVFDDTESQQDVLLSASSAFRYRAHWLLALGTVALIAWVLGRVGLLMWQTKRRTEEVIAAIDDPELGLMGRFGANVGAGGFVWFIAVSLTIAAFCVGVILLLANM